MLKKYEELSNAANGFEAVSEAARLMDKAATLLEAEAARNTDPQTTELLVQLALGILKGSKAPLLAANGFGAEFKSILEKEFGGDFWRKRDSDLRVMAKSLAKEIGAPGLKNNLFRMLKAASVSSEG